MMLVLKLIERLNIDIHESSFDHAASVTAQTRLIAYRCTFPSFTVLQWATPVNCKTTCLFVTSSEGQKGTRSLDKKSSGGFICPCLPLLPTLRLQLVSREKLHLASLLCCTPSFSSPSLSKSRMKTNIDVPHIDDDIVFK